MTEIIKSTISQLEFIKVNGRLDFEGAEKLKNEVTKIFNDNHSKNFVFDLSKIEYCSSNGIRIFVKLRKDLEYIDGKVAFLNPSSQITELLEMAGLTNFFIIGKSWELIINQLT